MSFNDKVVIVTGGSSGIGAVTAILFAKEGAQVAIVGRNQSKLKNVTEQIREVGKPPLVITADVGNEEEVKTIVKKTIDEFGKLDLLVNIAGIIRFKTAFDKDALQTFDEVMSVNLRPVVQLTYLAIPHLIKSKGNIVNISSVGGTTPIAGFEVGRTAYCTSKAAINHFSRVVALELAEHGVRVNVVSPGPVKTDILENAGRKANWEDLVQLTALKICTQPEEIANMVLYLASDKARSITGSNFQVDAGVRLLY